MSLHVSEDGKAIALHYTWCTGDIAESVHAFKALASGLADYDDWNWLHPVGSPQGAWVLDFDAYREVPEHDELPPWAIGQVVVNPSYSTQLAGHCGVAVREPVVSFEIRSAEMNDRSVEFMLPHLTPFLRRFRKDHPDPAKVAFLMMSFEDTRMHRAVVAAIREACAAVDVTALRSDDRIYADDLWTNIQTYMVGCGLGIAVYDRVTTDEFNPNVSLEVGYMLGLRRPVRLLKDQTLNGLQSDLTGLIYHPIDLQNPRTSVRKGIHPWLVDLVPTAGEGLTGLVDQMP